MALATSRFDVAAPFLASALLLFLCPFAVLAVVRRLASLYRTWPEEQTLDVCAPQQASKVGGRSQHQQPPLIGDPDQAAQNVIWAVDASQILSIFLGPISGLFILRSHVGTAVAILYVATIVVSVAGFLGFTFKARPDRYHTLGWWIFTPVSLLGLAATLTAAAAAALLGP